MTTHRQTIPALEQWRFEGSRPDWQDILNRAGEHRRSVPAVRRRRALFAGATAALVVGAPAFAVAIFPGLLASRHGELVGEAQLRGGRATGRFELRRLPAIAKGKPLLVGLQWKMRLEGVGSRVSAQIRISQNGVSSIELCRQCGSSDDGRILLPRNRALAVVRGGRVVVEAGPTKLSGIVHPPKS